MKRHLLKGLWALRFNKMRKVENEMFDIYESLLKDCGSLPKIVKVRHFIKTTLEGIAEDEKRHAGLVDRLVGILKRQKD